MTSRVNGPITVAIVDDYDVVVMGLANMFDEVLSASGDEARHEAFIDLRQLLAVHETAEEMIVHPRARGELEGGDAIVDARLKEEHDAKAQLQELQKMDIGSAEFLNALKEFELAVTRHADLEETEEFNQLQREISAGDLKRMASAVRAAEAIAPTRPHPGVESAKANFVAGPFAAKLSRTLSLTPRDRPTRRPRRVRVDRCRARFASDRRNFLRRSTSLRISLEAVILNRPGVSGVSSISRAFQ